MSPRGVLLTLGALFLSTPAGAQDAPPVFRFETVDHVYSGGWHVSIRTNSQDKVHLAYDGHYAVQDGTTWHIERPPATLSPNSPTLVLTSDDTPVIVFREISGGGPSWLADSFATLVTRQPDGWHSAALETRAWTVMTNAARGFLGTDSHLLVASNGQIKFETASTLVHVRQGAELFRETIADQGVFTGAAIAVDRHDRLHLAVGSIHEGALALEYWFRGSTGQWNIERVAGRYNAASLALDPEAHPLVVYHDIAGRTLWVATRRESGWTSMALVPSELVSSTSLEIDPTGTAHLAYIDLPTQSVHYARASAPYDVWQMQEVDRRRAVNGNIALAIDSRGDVHIAYADTWDNDIIHATTSPEVSVSPQSWSRVKSAFR